MKQNVIKCLGVTLVLLIFFSCQRDNLEAQKNLEQIYEEEGIPVKVQLLEEQNFSTYLSFTSTLKGIMESTGSSLVSDTVEEVQASVGDFVEKDQPIVRFPKNNPSANYYQSQAAFQAAENAFQRVENLYQSNGISRQSYDDAKTQYEVQKANWKTVNDMIEVKSPISGYITRLNVRQADNVHPGEVLFTVSNYDQLRTVVWVSGHEISRIRNGQRAYARWQDAELEGTVTQVDLSMDAQRKAFAVYLTFENEDHAIPSGVTGAISIETLLIQDSLVVNRSHILKNQQEWYVFLDRDGKAVRQVIEPGVRQGMYYQVQKGLNPGDRLITQGLNLVREGSPLNVVEEQSSVVHKGE